MLTGMSLALAMTAAAPGDYSVSEETGPIRFAYSWPAEVEAMPPLRTAMRARMAADRARATAEARRHEVAARRGHYPFAQNSYEASWSVEGRSARLVSLSAVVETFTGGGHGEHSYDQFVWDLTTGRELSRRALHALVASAAPRAEFCAAFTVARAIHLGNSASLDVEGEDERDCPASASLAVAPADRDGNGRFEAWRFYINTGNFDVEGFTVDMPLGPADVARIPPAYRASFESGR